MTNPESIDGDEAIAIVGMACRVPGADTVGQFWQNLLAGHEAIERLPMPTDAPSGHIPAAARLSDVAGFDADYFGLTPREAELTDPQHRLFLEQCQAALDAAGYGDPATLAGRTGVWGGVSFPSYLVLNVIPSLGQDSLLAEYPAQMLQGNDKDYLTSRVAHRLGLTGPAVTVQTACSTSLVAVAQACQALLDYQCDAALAGGACVLLPADRGYRYETGGIQSPDGHCRPFDADAAGTVFGSGVGVVLLKRLADAQADGDPIQAVIRGAAINNDGARKLGYTAPSIDGQVEVITDALASAGLGPDSVGYVEAHGTGTAVGDPVELAALDAGYPGTDPIWIGSVKSNLGHLNAAAGVIGLIKAALVVQHGRIPANLHYRRPNPRAARDTRFRVVADCTEWPAQPEPRRAAVSSFGVGGTNAHVILEQPHVVPSQPGARRFQVLPISARTERAVTELCAAIENSPAPAADLAHTLQTGRRAFSQRNVLIRSAETGVSRGRIQTARPGSPVAFLFPGQGSQYLGLTAELLDTEPVYAETVAECAETLLPILGRDIRDILAGRAVGLDLADTRLAQPLLFTVEYSLARWWQSIGIEPWVLLGHSVGEWAAAAVAGVFRPADALGLVAARGLLVAECAAGAMLAVELPEAEARALAPDLEVAALNAPARTVLSGSFEAIADAEQRCVERQIEARRLFTSHAFHSRSLTPAMDQLTAMVAATPRQAPQLPFVSNVTGDLISAEEATNPAYWGRQLREPVRFADGVRTIQAGQPVLLEVGPGAGLGRFAQQTDPTARVVASVRGERRPGPDDRVLADAVGQLWQHGVDIDWSAYRGDRPAHKVAAPGYPFQRTRYWVGPNGVADHQLTAVPATSQAGPATNAPAAVSVSGLPTPPERLEDSLIAIWFDLLGRADITEKDDLFSLGGDSLTATKIVSRSNRQFGVDIPLDVFLDEPTVSRLAELVVLAQLTQSDIEEVTQS